MFWKCVLWLFVYFPDLCQWWKPVQKSHYMALSGRRKLSNDCSWSVCILQMITVLRESYVWHILIINYAVCAWHEWTVVSLMCYVHPCWNFIHLEHRNVILLGVRNEHGNWKSFLPSAVICDVVSNGFVSVTDNLNVRSDLIGGVWNCSPWEVQLFAGCWKKYY